MDCVLSSHAVRPFCAALACLSRIGRDLYLEFDPIEDGLALRALNDAKSAYACVRCKPAFFERCTAPPTTSTRRRQHQQHNSNNNNNKRTLSQASSSASQQPSQSQEEMRFSCRVALRALAAVVKPRKNVVSLRIRSETETSNSNHSSASADGDGALFLSFEFHLQQQQAGSGGGDKGALPLLRVVHRIRAADAAAAQAVAPTDGCSELVAPPKLLLSLLDPLKRTTEAALFVGNGTGTTRSEGIGANNNNEEVPPNKVSASSFHHSTDTAATNHTNNNAILQATSASLLKVSIKSCFEYTLHSITFSCLSCCFVLFCLLLCLKTETAVACDEFDDFYFRDDRGRANNTQRLGGDDDEEEEDDDMPANVNEQVVLVFPLKEAKSFLQFCSSQQSQSQFDDALGQGLRVAFHFHWGGRPVIFQTTTTGSIGGGGGLAVESTSFSAQLVLATLDHKLLLPFQSQKQ